MNTGTSGFICIKVCLFINSTTIKPNLKNFLQNKRENSHHQRIQKKKLPNLRIFHCCSCFLVLLSLGTTTKHLTDCDCMGV